MTRISKLWMVPLFALNLLAGCALTNKAQPIIPRFFSPELPQARGKAQLHAGVELRLGRVQAAAHIRDHIMFRDSQYEIGFYEQLLWTERPDAYLRRALTQVLFEEEGVRSVVIGAVPTLDVELVNFEEIRAPHHLALVRVTLSLRDDRVVRVEQTLTVEQPISDGDKAHMPSAIAAALGDALRTAVHQICDRVLPELTAPPPPLPARAAAK